MRSTGPILAIGAVTLANESIVQGKPVNWRVITGTGIAAALFGLGEQLWAKPVVALSWLALVSTLFVRTGPNTPAPMESFLKWWNEA